MTSFKLRVEVNEQPFFSPLKYFLPGRMTRSERRRLGNF
jgi:hypothetical protein